MREAAFGPGDMVYYQTMAAVATLTVKLRQHSRGLIIPVLLRWTNRKTRRTIRHANSIVQMAPRDLQAAIVQLRELLSGMSALVSMLDDLGFTTNLLTRGPLKILRRQMEELEDIIEHFELSFDPRVGEDVSKALAEHERGETIDLESLL